MIQELRRSFFEEGFQVAMQQRPEQEIQQEELKTIQELGSLGYASPDIQVMHKTFFKEGFEEGIRQRLEQGRQQEEMEAIQNLQARLVMLVGAKYPDLQGIYPSLVDIARQQACRFDTPDLLNLIIRQVVAAPDVGAARKLLETGPQM